MKRFVTVMVGSVIALSGCGVFGSESTNEPTMIDRYEAPTDNSDSGNKKDNSNEDPNAVHDGDGTEIDREEEYSPTFIYRSNCEKGLTKCDETRVTLYHDSTTSNGRIVDENFIDQYKEAALYSEIQNQKSKGFDKCETEELGVEVPEWDHKTVFFCEYENGHEDTMQLITEKVLESAGVLKK